MIDAIIRGSLGNIGSAILDFYIANALWINIILITYALIVFSGKQANQKIKAAIRESLITAYGEDVRKKNVKWFTRTLEKTPLDWQTIATSSWIPVFSLDKSLWVKIKSEESLKAAYSPEIIRQIFDDDAQTDSGGNIQS